MKKTISLNQNHMFKRAYYKGKSCASDCLVLYYLKSRGGNRLGITVSKKVGKAVVRNRVRRLIKENYRLLEDRIGNGVDIVVVARSKAAQKDFHAIGSALRYVLRKCELLSV